MSILKSCFICKWRQNQDLVDRITEDHCVKCRYFSQFESVNFTSIKEHSKKGENYTSRGLRYE